MPSRTSILVWATTALLAQSATAHMVIEKPVPFSVDKLDNGPLQAGDFPCKQKLGFTVSTMNEMQVGAQQSLVFKGSAVHGGGSCQLAVTLDKEPNANSKFKVIKSIEGGCPGVDGGPSTFNYEIPDVVPNGEATFAWTWFSKLSGVPEMYMNCAPITVSGGASDSSGFDALPDMFVANIPEAQCTSPQNFDTKFPNPGSAVEEVPGSNLKAPEGSTCGTASGGGDSDPDTGNPDTPSSPVGAPTPAPPTPTPEPAPSSSVGGIFAPGASSAAPDPEVPDLTAVLTTLMTVTAAPSGTAVVTGEVPANTGTGDGGANGTACSTNGAVVCNGPNQFGLCNFGKVVWQDVAAGTTCANGVISKRSPSRVMKRAHHALVLS